MPSASVTVPPRISANPPRALGATRFVAFGDSITSGVTSSFDPNFLFISVGFGYPERLQAGLNTYHAPQQFIVINEGVPGERAQDAVTRFRSAITRHRPHAVLLLEGINDLGDSDGVSRAIGGLRRMLDAAAVLNTPVIIATMFQTYEVTGPDGRLHENGATVVPSFNTEVRRLVVGRQNVFLLDVYPLMNNRAFVGNDGLHLNDAGFEAMASAFLDAVEDAFPVRGSFQ